MAQVGALGWVVGRGAAVETETNEGSSHTVSRDWVAEENPLSAKGNNANFTPR